MLPRLYSKLDPIVLVIVSNSVKEHHFLIQRDAHVLSRTRSCIHNLREVVNMDRWRTTALFPFESMQAASPMSLDENTSPGSALSYQWYTKIGFACGNLRLALVAWLSCVEEFDFEFLD